MNEEQAGFGSIRLTGVHAIACDYMVDTELWQVSVIFNERTPLHCGQFGDHDKALLLQRTLIDGLQFRALQINKAEEKKTVAVLGYTETGELSCTHWISPNDIVEVRINKLHGGGWNVVIDMGTYEILRWHFVAEKKAAKRLADIERARLGIPTGKKGTDGWLNPR